MKLEDIRTGANLAGIEPTQVVSVVATVPLAEGSIQLIYRTPDGSMKERLLSRADEQSIDVATAERPFSFDGDGSAFQLACEAKRIDLAFLFDPMMAVHTSNVEPLPHYERTFITEGMGLLLTQVAQRLAGKGGEPVVQLQTASRCRRGRPLPSPRARTACRGDTRAAERTPPCLLPVSVIPNRPS